MKILLSWLQEFVDLDVPSEYLAKILTNQGIEVEKIEKIKPDFSHIVVARIDELKKHPDAEKLVLTRLFDGENYHDVICGAPNCRLGMKTALALPGAVLKDDEEKPWKIKRTKIRGLESFGMLCSGKELKISDDADGILEFSEHIKEGTDVADLFSDTLFDVSLTPNLGHAASVRGIARELAAALEKPLKTPFEKEASEKQSKLAELSSYHIAPKIEDEDTYSCHFCLIEGVKVAPSPLWLQKRLEIAGFRPINNVVDITNYVLLEMGQPLHAYDRDKLAGSKIALRKAKAGEALDGLDDMDYPLIESDLVIADEKGPVSLAGVLGGRRTAITEGTQNVLLEAAHFSPTTLRRTARRLGLLTESSRRFERGIDPEGVEKAFERAADLIVKIAGGKKVAKFKEIKKQFPSRKIGLRVPRLNRLLGTLLSTSEVENFLARLGFLVREVDGETLEVTIPSYRHDLNIEEDLYEEVLRLYGYDRITGIQGVTFSQTAIPDHPLFQFEKRLEKSLLGEGLHQLITCDLISPWAIDTLNDPLLPKERAVPLKNAASSEQSVLRISLLPCHLSWVKYNEDRFEPNLQGFEIGKVYFMEEDQVRQKEVIGITLAGTTPPIHWENKPHEVDFYDLKGILERLLNRLGIENVHFQKYDLSFFHPGRQAAIFSDSRELLGAFGELHPETLMAFGIKQRVLFAELDIGALLALAKKERFMQEIPSYPGSERDWTLTLDEAFEVEGVMRAIDYSSSLILEKVSLLDLYRSEALGKDKKNATFRFFYRDPQKTLEQETVDREHERILHHVALRLEREKTNSQ